jgi:type I restriction enzyme S subunit
MRGASYPAVTDNDVFKSLIPLPPLEWQRRIVARIEELMSRIREAKRLHQEAKEDAGRLMQAALVEVFPRPGAQLPQGWKWVKLGEVWLKPQYGFTASAVNQSVGPKFLRITDIQNGQVNWDTVPYCEIDNELLRKYRLEPGDLLFARIGATTGKSLLIRECPEAIFASYLIRVRVDSSRVLPEFLFYFTQGDLYWSQVDAAKGGRLKQGINIPVLSSFPLPLPPLPEQKKIAEILSAVDRAIEEADKAIEKTEKLEQGLMEKLLTEGIGHTDFQDTEIGRIPKDWKVVRLGEVCEKRGEVYLPSKSDKYKFVGLEHIFPGERTVKNYAFDADLKSSKFKFYPGDILYGKLRPYLDKAALAEFEGICSTDLLVLRCILDQVFPEFLVYILHTRRFIEYAIATTAGTNHPRTSWKSVRDFPLPLPPLPEQKKIAEILMTVDRKMELLRKKRELLRQVKKGLMEDLLTGRVRVLKLLGKEVEHGAVS